MPERRTDPAASPAPDHSPLRIAARPEFTGGRRVGVLLSHGFTGSPASVRAWGEHLAEFGFGVAAPRLPGHGTSWQELNDRGWDDWYGEVQRVFDDLCLDHDAVVVGGLSMGGALALRLAADHAPRVAGVVLVNPALASNRLDIKLLPLLQRVVPSFPAIGGDIAKPGAVEYAYDRTPLRALHSFRSQWRPLQRDLGRVTAPLLYFRSSIDHVVDDASTPIILAGVGSREITRVPLQRSYHVATLDHDAPTIFETTAAFVARVGGVLAG